MDRRAFFKAIAIASGAVAIQDWKTLYAKGTGAPEVGKAWKGWKKGHFEAHFIYTGVAESIFFIFPDGTSMLLDCGDHNAAGRGKLAVPILPHPGRHSGEWIARYVERVNPGGTDVDYMMISHYHSDHAGCEEFYASKEGDYCYSGFSQAARTLTFHKAIDRAWPGFDDPLPLDGTQDRGTLSLIRKFYARMREERGMDIEKFRLGATDQIVMEHSPATYKDFCVRNICANGRLCGEDGVVKDLFAEKIRKEHLTILSENAMSMGMIISYGPFKMYTAGDFSCNWDLEDGTRYRIEDEMAKICGSVNVAKINHHGHHSMPPKLVQALKAQVYVSSVWDQLHNTRDTIKHISDRNLYPGDRIVCPGVFPAERRAKDSDQPWLSDITGASFDGGHVILDVEPGGKRFSITYLTAADESMIVRSVMDFKTEKR